MTSGWVPVRVVRWPAQQQDREWCAQRSLPCLLLVPEGAARPQPGPAETVLPATADEAAVAAAVDELAWRGPVRAARVERTAVGSRRGRPVRRPRSLVGAVAALL